jgi:septum formation protein
VSDKRGAHLILASGSGIRRRLLANAGLRFSVLAADIDESGHDAPRERAARLARQKAQAVALAHPDAWVIGADQVGELGPDFQVELQKPWDESTAKAQLLQMQGKWHRLTSAAALVHGEEVVAQVSETTRIRFHELDEGAAQAYIALGEWRGSCGGYQIENRGARLVAELDGSLNAVLGLPLFPLLNALRENGF